MPRRTQVEAVVAGRFQGHVTTLAAASPPAESSSAEGIPDPSAATPHSTLPSMRPPLNTICVTAKPRALTQSGSATCAATIRLDITASQAAPMTSMIGIASARVCTSASAAVAAAVTRPPPSTSRSGEMRRNRRKQQRAGDGARADRAEQHAVDMRPAAELVARDQRQQRPIGAGEQEERPGMHQRGL